MSIRHTPLPPSWRIAVCGLGLIGGSVVKALRQSGFTGHITGFDPDQATLAAAHGLIDAAAPSPEQLADDHDLVVLCQPVGNLLASLALHRASMQTSRAVLVDVASVKAPVVEIVRAWPEQAAARFVPCHPIAGKASHGWAASEACLFQGKLCVMTPDAATDDAAFEMARAFWHSLGATTTTLPAAEHDAVYAGISHLPQLLSYAYLHSLAMREESAYWLAYRGTGFESFARLGASDARLWADISIHNAQALIGEIDRVSDSLALFRHYVSHRKFAELTSAFSQARSFHAQSGPAVDAA